MENGFIAKPCNFQGVNGYMLDQYYQGRVVCSQFVPESSFDYFCKVACINPKLKNWRSKSAFFRGCIGVFGGSIPSAVFAIMDSMNDCKFYSYFFRL